MKQEILKDETTINISVPYHQTIDEYLEQITKELNEYKEVYLTEEVVRHELSFVTNPENLDDIYIYTYRLETDEEEQERIKKQEEAERKRLYQLEWVERTEYERLKEKFG